MASVVRPIPAIRASRAPRLATAAPTPTSGTAQSASTASTALTSGVGARPEVRAERQKHGRGDDGVDRNRDAESQGDRTRDRALRVADLLPERRDPRVAGEGEEEQPGRLEDPVEPAGELDRQIRRCRAPLPRIAPTTTASAASDTATRIRVSPAVRVMPRRLTAVSASRATTATGRSSQLGPGTA